MTKRVTIWLLLLVCMACGGTLSDEQRKRMKERMQSDEIKKITEGELMEAAFNYGRNVVAELQKSGNSVANPDNVRAIESQFAVKVYSIQPDDSTLLSIESKVLEAYITGGTQSTPGDDIQKIGTDSLLYTKPIVRERPDGSVEFVSALMIHMPVKSVVLSIKD